MTNAEPDTKMWSKPDCCNDAQHEDTGATDKANRLYDCTSAYKPTNIQGKRLQNSAHDDHSIELNGSYARQCRPSTTPWRDTACEGPNGYPVAPCARGATEVVTPCTETPKRLPNNTWPGVAQQGQHAGMLQRLPW